MKMKRFIHAQQLAVAACLGLLLMPVNSRAVDSAPVPPAGIEEKLPELSLAGAGEFSVMFWDIYTAALWAPGGEYSSEEPHVLALRYARDFDGGDIAERSIQEIRGLRLGSSEQHDAWLESMRALFPDVVAGDQLTGLHLPGEKAVFYRNNQRLGEIMDAGFARAFFAIWLDENTAAPDLRRQLLGMDASDVAERNSTRATSGGTATPAGST